MAANFTDLLQSGFRLHQDYLKSNDPNTLQQARDHYHVVLNHSPDDPATLFLLGSSYLQEDKNGLAIALLEKAGSLQSEAAEIWNNLGSCWKRENNTDKAKTYYEKALAIQRDPDYLCNIATLWVNEGCPDNGIVYGFEALEKNPDHNKAAWNLSLLLLESGNWDQGFHYYRRGIDSGDRVCRFFDNDHDRVPFWQGETGKVIVYGEQGLGDEILFASALPDIMKDHDIIFECHPRLENIFRRSFPDLTIYGTRKEETIHWQNDADYKCPIGDLFYFYRRDGQFPRTPYLTPNPELVQSYRVWLQSLGDPPYVGIGWAGGSKQTHGSERSLKLSWFEELFKMGGTFVSIQYTDVAEKIRRFNQKGFRIHQTPAVTAFDYDHNLALMAALDLVICINTTAAHACGAMGTTCWTLTPHKKAWRYYSKPNDHRMFAYNSVLMIQQKKDESWPSVINRTTELYKKTFFAGPK